MLLVWMTEVLSTSLLTIGGCERPFVSFDLENAEGLLRWLSGNTSWVITVVQLSQGCPGNMKMNMFLHITKHVSTIIAA